MARVPPTAEPVAADGADPDRCPALREAATLIYPLDVLADPEDVWRLLMAERAREPNVFWLDGGVDGISYLGTGEGVPLEEGSTLDALRGEVQLPHPAADALGAAAPAGAAGSAGSVGSVLGRRNRSRVERAAEPVLGLIGWLGYELRRETAGYAAPAAAEFAGPEHPESVESVAPVASVASVASPQGGSPTRVSTTFIRVDRAIAVDARSGRVELLAAGKRWTLELEHWAMRLTASLRDSATVAEAAPGPRSTPVGVAAGRTDAYTRADTRADADGYTRADADTADTAGYTRAYTDTDASLIEKVDECQRLIAMGEAYQLCLTSDATISGDVDLIETYRLLRADSPAPYNAVVLIGGVTLMSASPERFLQLGSDRRLRTQPIKGTRPRSHDPKTDRRLAAELASDEKERAENVMIVDLMRNDFARVCESHSVQVERLFEVQSFEHVHQLVSTVVGWLDPGCSSIDAIEACFPAGSMTGTPKIRATELLDVLEGRERGAYSGAFGFVGASGTLDLAMTIRTIVADERGATVGAGAGITGLSRPDDEVAEIRLKARPLLEAVRLR